MTAEDEPPTEAKSFIDRTTRAIFTWSAVALLPAI